MSYTIKGRVYNVDGLLLSAGIPKEVSKRSFDHETKTMRNVKYLNIPCAIDTESTSYFTPSGRKVGFVWAWQIGIDGAVFIGRKMTDLVETIKKITRWFDLNDDHKMLIYCHNLQHDFQFIKKFFKWGRIFAREEKSVISAEIKDSGIEFRCSYYLTGCSLAIVGENLPKYKVAKLVGDLDYDEIRTWDTPYTRAEANYMVNDCLVIMSRIACEIEEAGGRICDIPLTKTGKVRKYCRDKCLNDKKYQQIIRDLTMDADTYEFCKRAFMGGFTHASWLKSEMVLKNVGSNDFTSAYPACMLLPVFPVSRGTKIIIKDREDFDNLIKRKCVIFNVHFEGVREKFEPEHYLSTSKLFDLKDAKEDNGRLISASSFSTTITEIDFSIIEKCYDIDNITFGSAIIFDRGYLPKALIECVLDFYEKKTTLKGIESEDGSIEALYQLYKEMLNSCFGCCVTDPVNDLVEYCEEVDDRGNDWKTTPGDEEEALAQYNKSRSRFLYYPWGIYITSANRRNLWSGIFECGFDYVYSDTDSIKCLNREEHKEYFDRYDRWITSELVKCCAYYGINTERLSPCDKNGNPHPLGVWDFETSEYKNESYERFKTLGAKRYIFTYLDKDDKCHLKCTIAGVNKKETAKWLLLQTDPFNTFCDEMEVPEEYSGRNVLEYFNRPYRDMVTDYLGNTVEVYSPSGVNFSKSSYHLTLNPIYAGLLESRERSFL